MRIDIDFQGGSHGNFLEFACNKLIGVSVGLPFNSFGASHKKQYSGEKLFFTDHYSFWSKASFQSTKIISIQIDIDDLLPLQQISLLRAGPGGGGYGYDNEFLEIDTYNKLNNSDYRWVLEQLMTGFFKNQIKESYDALKDPSWPEVNNKSDYLQLPQWIQDECKNVHNLILLDINEQCPDCPRYILREFFQIGFTNPQQHGFIARQNLVSYPEHFDVFVFPFNCFYNAEKFMKKIESIASWAGLQYNCQQEIAQLHGEFLNRQPYKDSKFKCDEIVMKIQNDTLVHTPTVDLLEEAYINAKLGWNYFV